MIKIFSMLSVMFALLAGFSACGAEDYERIKYPEEEDYPGDTAYGAGYSIYITAEISGKVIDEDKKRLEKIKIVHRPWNEEFIAYTDSEGDFNLVFEYYCDNLNSLDVELQISDSENIYESKEKLLTIKCQPTYPEYLRKVECKKEMVEIVMEKIDGESYDKEDND